MELTESGKILLNTIPQLWNISNCSRMLRRIGLGSCSLQWTVSIVWFRMGPNNYVTLKRNRVHKHQPILILRTKYLGYYNTHHKTRLMKALNINMTSNLNIHLDITDRQLVQNTSVFWTVHILFPPQLLRGEFHFYYELATKFLFSSRSEILWTCESNLFSAFLFPIVHHLHIPWGLTNNDQMQIEPDSLHLWYHLVPLMGLSMESPQLSHSSDHILRCTPTHGVEP